MIDKYTIEEALREQQQELAAQTATICTRKEEDYVDLSSNLAQVVIGVRRSGKSTLCQNVLHKANISFAYVNFDDERLCSVTGADLNDILAILYKIYGQFDHLFIDEIQNIDEWFLFVNRLLRQNIHILITGSNAKLLSGELATHLTGRHTQIELFPFSFADFCGCKNVDTQTITTEASALRHAVFDEYLHSGGFPETLHEKNKMAYINNLVNGIIGRDIQGRHNIRYSGLFLQLSQHLLNTVPLKINLKALQEQFNISSFHTVENYISYLKQAYLLVGIHKYSTKSRIRLRNEKLYAIDVALMSNRVDAFAANNLGWRLETVVLIELMRRYHPQQCDIYYYAETAGEADFVICRGSQTLLAIQVSYDISNPKTLKRELKGLALAAKATNCDNLLLITNSNRGETTTADGKKVTIVAACEWLLGMA